MKVCSKCKIEKELSEFPKQSCQKDGLRPSCKVCHNLSNKEYVAKNREKVLERSRAAYHKDIEKSRSTSLDYYYRNRDVITKKQSARNREKWSEKTDEEKYLHGLKHRKRQLLWKSEHSDRIAYHLANRRATKKNATPAWLTKEQKKEIAQFYKTAKIMSEFHEIEYQVDHIEPLCGKTSNGLHVPWNLQVITAEENRRKLNKLNN